MKLTVLCFCFLHVSFISAGLLSTNDLQSAGSSGLSRSGSRTQTPQNTESLNPGRKRPLFARRGQYERQRVHVPKPKKVPAKETPPPPAVVSKPPKPKCSQLTQSCLPQSGCCEAGSTCHCRFFNAICFCRRTNSSHKKKT
uniref:agouti-signaling protein-like n=1 Tax=Semicossyphus pulcher TaxID=241346 RepID=UPI0037E78E93